MIGPLKGISGEGWKGWQVGLMVGVPVTVAGGFFLYKRYKNNSSISNPPLKPEDEARKYKTQGNEYFKGGRYPSAIDSYSKAIELEDSVTKADLATFHQNRAAAYDQMNNYLHVIKDCSTAISLNPRYLKALSRRARAYHKTGFLNEALEDVTSACVLEGFSVGKNVQLADVIIKELCGIKAEKKIKTRQPKQPSANQVARFLVSFSCDPVFNSPEYLHEKLSANSDKTSLQDTSDKTSLQDTSDKTSLQDTSDNTSLQDTSDNTSLQDTSDKTFLQDTSDNTSLQETSDKTSLQDISDKTFPQETFAMSSYQCSNYKKALMAFVKHDYNNTVKHCNNHINNSHDNNNHDHNNTLPQLNSCNDGSVEESNIGGDEVVEDEGYKSNVLLASRGVAEELGGGEAVTKCISDGGLPYRNEEEEEEDDGIDILENGDDDGDETILYDNTATAATATTLIPSTATTFIPSTATTFIPRTATSTTATPSSATATPSTAISTTATPSTATSTTAPSYQHEAQSLLATYHLLCCNMEEALTHLTSLSDDPTASVQMRSNSLLKRAKVHTCGDDMENAMADYTTALLLHPTNPDAYLHRGQFHLVNERLNEAIADFSRALELKDDVPEAHIHKTFTESRRALLEGRAGEMNELLEDFKNIITKFPLYAEAHVFYGQALQDAQRFEEADESYQRAIQLDPQSSNAYVHRGVFRLSWRNDLEGGLELVRKGIRVDPSNAFAYQALGTVLFQKGDIEAAVENVQKAIENVSSKAEMAHLYTILEAAHVQTKVASKLGVNLNH